MKILIAEDDKISRKILELILSKNGDEILLAEDGIIAMDLIEQENPEIVILDWMMPGLDGIQLCKYIRHKNENSYTYIILQTSKSSRADIKIGYNAGADDYLIKPVSADILRQKLKVATRILEYEKILSDSKKELERYATEMETLAKHRADQLVHADKMATLGILSAGIAHEINNPTAYISGNIQTMEKLWDKVKDEIASIKTSNSMIEFMCEEYPKMMSGIKSGVKSISKIVSGLKMYSRQSTHDKVLFNIREVINQSLDMCKNSLKYNIKVVKSIPENVPQIYGDKQQIQQVMVNLIVNSADAMAELDTGELKIAVRTDDKYFSITVSDNGCGVDTNAISKIFDPFYTTKGVGKGTGLGMSITKGIIDEHYGKISIKNGDVSGAIVTIRLPICSNESECKSITMMKE